MTEYLVSHGKSGAFGRFRAPAMNLRRGDRVVVQTYRGLELGKVLCPATERHQQALQHARGEVVRHATVEDEMKTNILDEVSRRIVDAAAKLARTLDVAVETLDAEVLLDGRHAVLHFLGQTHVDAGRLLKGLADNFQLEVIGENLAAPVAEDHHEEHGCGKPDCGKTEGGGCSSCETGGGCSSCGSGGVDMKAYFAHLRGKMETSGRVPLV